MHNTSIIMRATPGHLDPSSPDYVEGLKQGELVLINVRMCNADGTQDWFHTLGAPPSFSLIFLLYCVYHWPFIICGLTQDVWRGPLWRLKRNIHT
jgi:hypothetical protein